MAINQAFLAGPDRQLQLLDRRMASTDQMVGANQALAGQFGQQAGQQIGITEAGKDRAFQSNQQAIQNLLGAVQFVKQHRLQEKQLNEQRKARRQGNIWNGVGTATSLATAPVTGGGSLLGNALSQGESVADLAGKAASGTYGAVGDTLGRLPTSDPFSFRLG